MRPTNKNERIVARAKNTNWRFLRDIFIAILVFAAWAVLHYYFKQYVKTEKWVAICGAIFVGLVFLCECIAINANKLVLTSQKLTSRRGLLMTEFVDIPLRNIDNISTIVSPLGRMLDYGTIKVELNGKVYYYKFISRAIAFSQKISEQIGEVRG